MSLFRLICVASNFSMHKMVWLVWLLLCNVYTGDPNRAPNTCFFLTDRPEPWTLFKFKNPNLNPRPFLFTSRSKPRSQTVFATIFQLLKNFYFLYWNSRKIKFDIGKLWKNNARIHFSQERCLYCQLWNQLSM